MDTPHIDIVRALTAPVALRAAAEPDDGLGLLQGHFSAFNEWYEVNSMWEGNFMERTAPGAFLQTIDEDRSNMRVLFDHGHDPQIGNKVLGPIRTLEEDSVGPRYEVPLFDTSYNRDLLPGLKEGVYGASFRFRAIEDQWNDEPGSSAHNPKGLPERTITRTKTMEFGPVCFPASPAATAGVRSMTDEFYSRLRQRDVVAYQEAVRSAGIADPSATDPAAPAASPTLSTAARLLADAQARRAAATTAAPDTDPTGQPDARSAGDGAGTPSGNDGAPQPIPEELRVRDRTLRMIGVIK